MNYRETLTSFLEKTTNKDPFDDYLIDGKLDDTALQIDQEKKKQRAAFFIPMSKENLISFFTSYETEAEAMYALILKETRGRTTGFSVHPSENPEALMLRFTDAEDNKYGSDHVFDFKNKLAHFERIIESKEGQQKYELKYYDPIIKFLFFVHQKSTFNTISALEKEVSSLQEEKLSAALVSKAPVNMLNVILTSKSETLGKLERKKREFEKLIEKTPPGKAQDDHKRRKKFVEELIEKADINFPDDFRFTVYEQYAMFGIMMLLDKNNFMPTEFSATAVLKALNFKLNLLIG